MGSRLSTFALSQMIKDVNPNVTLFFLHIPFPSFEILEFAKGRQLKGMLGVIF